MSARQATLERRLESLESRIDALVAVATARGPRPVPVEAAAPRVGSAHVPNNLETIRLGPERSPDGEDLLAAILTRDSSLSPDAQCDAVLQALVEGAILPGADAALAFADRYPTHPRSSEVLFAAGRGLRDAGELHLAAWTFKRVSDHYPLSRQAPEAMLMGARCELQLERKEDAHALLTQMIKRYPRSPSATLARTELTNIADGPTASAVQ